MSSPLLTNPNDITDCRFRESTSVDDPHPTRVPLLLSMLCYLRHLALSSLPGECPFFFPVFSSGVKNKINVQVLHTFISL